MKILADILLERFSHLHDWQSQYRHLILLGEMLPPFPIEAKNDDHLIHGCEAPIWLLHTFQGEIHQFLFESDAKIIRGLLMILLTGIQNRSTIFTMQFDFAQYLEKLGLAKHLSISRTSGLQKIFAAVQKAVSS